MLLAGEILAEAKIVSGGYGTKTSTYTSQVRGGPTKVDILLDKDEIIFPYAKEARLISCFQSLKSATTSLKAILNKAVSLSLIPIW